MDPDVLGGEGHVQVVAVQRLREDGRGEGGEGEGEQEQEGGN